MNSWAATAANQQAVLPVGGEIIQPRATLWGKRLSDHYSPERGERGVWMPPFQGGSFWFGIISEGAASVFLFFSFGGIFYAWKFDLIQSLLAKLVFIGLQTCLSI